MTKVAKFGIVYLLVDIITACLILFAVSLVHAQTVPDRGNSDAARANAAARNDHVPTAPTRRVCDLSTAQGDVHCDSHVVTDSGLTPLATPKIVAGYGPTQFLKGYNLGNGMAPKPTTIAIVDAYDDPNVQSDLNTYSSTMGIPPLASCSNSLPSTIPCFKKVNQKGSTTGLPRADSGWALEISLDVEVAHALCQNCKIILVEANSSSYNDLMTAVDQAVAQGATVVSNSYGSSEFSGETTLDSHFNHPGVAFTFSSGDSGYGAEYPAASPYVTAVGGTTLKLDSLSNYSSESAWSGAGSGCSAFESQMSWQTALGLSGCTHRMVADVAADADPNTGAAVYDSLSYYGRKGWFQVGGTSLASPLVAAMYALSGNTAGSANQLPYLNTGNFHDVTTGSNGSCNGSFLCTAKVGYDGPTGLGSPNAVLAL